MENRTKIICTIGPASSSSAVLQKMLHAGADAFRLNFSHGTYKQFAEIIKNIRLISKKAGSHIAIIQDLQGPKIRVGELKNGVFTIKKGQTIILSTIKPGKNEIPVQYKKLGKEVKKGMSIFIDDGMIELKVESVNFQKTKIKCRAVTDGIIKSRKGINAPGASISANSITKKDLRDLSFGISRGVDYVALSFVKNAKNIFALKRLIKKKNSQAQVIAKIERREAIENLEDIVKAADAVMIARGDLGIEIPAEQVPLLQKKIIHLCNTYGKPVIVATQMLNSMIKNPRATRAEISDAATAIFDHADALLLSNETSVGKYPVEAARTLKRVASAVEKDLKTHQHLLNLRHRFDMPLRACPQSMLSTAMRKLRLQTLHSSSLYLYPIQLRRRSAFSPKVCAFRDETILCGHALTNATCLNACKLAQDIHAKYIVAVTHTGYKAKEIAKYRPFIPIIVFTQEARVARQMALVWGVYKTFVQSLHSNNPLPQIRKILLDKNLIKPGDEIVVCD